MASNSIKWPYIIATHLRKFSASSALKSKTKAFPFGMVSGVPMIHNGTQVCNLYGGLPPVSLAAATLTLSHDLHDGLVVRPDIATGFTITLPAATGSGALYRIVVGTSLTSGSGVIQVGNANDYMRGQASTIGSSGITIALTANTGTLATESDTITWNRSTTGLGTQGDYVECYDLKANIWSVEAIYASSGAAATPFSAAV